MAIRIIVTGGTFDKQYDEIEGQLTFKDTHLPDILRQVRVMLPVVVETNQLIDSLYMTAADRQRVLAACREAPEEHIIITHGTDTMIETAQVLASAALPKTLVLTGALVPYSVSGSDALFNLGCSFTAVQLLAPGVYVVMNGKVFSWDNVRKDRSRGVFETLAPEEAAPGV